MNNYLVTGASGYLGSRIVKTVLEESPHASIMCPVLPNAPMNYLEPHSSSVHLVTTNHENFDTIIRDYQPDIVVHTACQYDRNGVSPASVADANLYFPLRIFNALLQSPKKALWVNTNTSLHKQLNAYTLSKHQFAEWGEYYANLGKMDFCNILLEHFYGIGDSGSKFLPFLLTKMRRNEAIDLTIGTQRRDFIYIDDVLQAFLLLIRTHPVGYSCFSLGAGEAPAVREIVEYMKELMSSASALNFGAVPLRDNEPEISVADIGALKKIGFHPQFNWRTGIAILIESEFSL